MNEQKSNSIIIIFRQLYRMQWMEIDQYLQIHKIPCEHTARQHAKQEEQLCECSDDVSRAKTIEIGALRMQKWLMSKAITMNCIVPRIRVAVVATDVRINVGIDITKINFE